MHLAGAKLMNRLARFASVRSTPIHPLRLDPRHLPLLRRLCRLLLVSTPFLVPIENMETPLVVRRRMVLDPLLPSVPLDRNLVETHFEQSQVGIE